MSAVTLRNISFTATSSIIAFSLLYSGAVHSLHPLFLLFTASSYEVCSLNSLMEVMVILLPYCELTCGVCIVIRVFERTAIAVASALFALFTIVQCTVLLRGGTASCNCFGYHAEPISVQSAAVPMACGILCAMSFVTMSSNGTVHRQGNRSRPGQQ